ncbi:hypothetical protein [Luteimonas aquatica]|uniref:hypothetical protein n=1 Tax=Luteimonas aquatica TaxID=450364 RepID=UPI001F57214E|nr:hypothetical protein [Luteimonas aquatica]
MSRIPGSQFRLALALSLLATALPGLAAIQSDAVSRQSAASLDASIEVPVAVSVALSEGARFAVTGVAASGEAVAVTVSAIGTGVSFVARVSARTAAAMAVSVGTVVVVTSVAAGWLLSVGDETLCFVANERARTLIHSRRLAA